MESQSENTVMKTKEPFWTTIAQIAQTVTKEKIQRRGRMDDEMQILLQQIEIDQNKR